MNKKIIGRNGFIDWSAILENNVNIYFVLGQRSDGKTYGIIQDSIKHYIETGVPSAYIRRFDESLKKYMLIDLCKPHNDFISKQSKKQWAGTVLKSKRFHFMTTGDDDKIVTDMNAFLYCYGLNTWENAKGPDCGEFYNVIFDECISTSKYLPNEYTAFENMLSTIMRTRTNSRVILLGNPINQICPYFDEYNIDIHKLKPGDIVYRISSTGDKLKFVFIPPVTNRKTAGIFKFRENSSITTGYWDFGEFPRVPSGMTKNSDYVFSFNVIFRKQFAVCDIYVYNGVLYCLWRPGNPDKIQDCKDIPTYSDIHIFRDNVKTAWNNFDEIGRIYSDIVKANRQYFADNRTGNLVKMWYTEFVQRAGRFV